MAKNFPTYENDECEKLLCDKEKLRAKAHSENKTEEDNEKLRNSRKKLRSL